MRSFDHAAVQHLCSSACGLQDLVTAHGHPGFYKDDKNGSPLCNFQSLAKAIVYQQLAGAAACTIWGRLLALAAEGQVGECHGIHPIRTSLPVQ